MSVEIIFTLLLLLFCVLGFFQGAISQLSKLFAGVGAYFITKLFYPDIRDYLLESKILNQENSNLFSFVVILLVIFISIKFISKLFESLLKSLGLNFTNRLAGVVVGLFKGVFILSIFAFGINKLNIFNINSSNEFSVFGFLYKIGEILTNNLF